MCNHPNREDAMVVIKPGVWCDPCIAPLVRALNDSPELPAVMSERFDAAITTLASCCGHGDHPGRISLADGRELLIFPSLDAADGRAPDDPDLLADLTDPDDCWYDHHGYCQAHGWFATEPACPHARAKAVLAALKNGGIR